MDPELYFAIDRMVAEMQSSDPRFFFGIVHLVLYNVTMRVRHCCRSVLTRLGSALLTGVCLRGKKRGGWEWRCPRYSPSGVDMGGILWRAYQGHMERRELPRALVGAFVHPDGDVPVEYDDVLNGCRTFLDQAFGAEVARQWTTYSARRAIPTVMDLLEFSDQKKSAAGHWPDARSNMPVRYSGARVATATVARAEAMEAIADVKRQVDAKLTWDVLAGARHLVDWRGVQMRSSRLVAEDVLVQATPADKLTELVPAAPAFDLSAMTMAMAPTVSPVRAPGSGVDESPEVGALPLLMTPGRESSASPGLASRDH